MEAIVYVLTIRAATYVIIASKVVNGLITTYGAQTRNILERILKFVLIVIRAHILDLFMEKVARKVYFLAQIYSSQTWNKAHPSSIQMARKQIGNATIQRLAMVTTRRCNNG
ncbi:hypothetical protein KIN20_006308 [Parelaphostrongylus tenuis]|uniref:Uncharacterized protein n=1 Tax=Parelaphostrongylus tenuis TaxID=148309 RepID=A0AAD5M5V8_PARTN|nr:hypothetical protein KIN20_006308 [Parelaphostrongylus tenuis]